MSARQVLVTGGAGFIGCNIAHRLAAEGHAVTIFDALRRPGVVQNLDWLRSTHGGRIKAVAADVRDAPAIADAVAEADAVFHMAAQVAVTTSLVDPMEDFEVNIKGTLLLLEALRAKRRRTPLIFASTNKVYGDLADVALRLGPDGHRPDDAGLRRYGIDETRPLSFYTPYGCSKGAADQYVLDYARSYGLPTCVLRMSCIYGPRQMGTEDQGWVAHFMIQALQSRPITVFGDGFQVRDIMHVSDAVDAYIAAWRNIEAVEGRAFNLGGGVDNAVSLRQIIAEIEHLTRRPLAVTLADWRAGDQRYFVADGRAIRGALNLPSPKPWQQGLADLARWLKTQHPGARLDAPLLEVAE